MEGNTVSPTAVSDRGRTVCVIGAGGSGLAAVKNLVEAGFDVDCYERETAVGGSLHHRAVRGSGAGSPHAGSTHLVTSRSGAQYPDFPMPDTWPDFPRTTQMLSYMERYADHFGLRDHIWFGTQVSGIRPVGSSGLPDLSAPAGGPPVEGACRWDVTIQGQRGGTAKIMRYSAVLVATGTTGVPTLPQYPGLSSYQGKTSHSSACPDAAVFRGRRVLVVGAGNTGCDLAVAASTTAAVCWHSSRRGYWFTPRYVLGQPLDQVVLRAGASRAPAWIRRAALHRALRLAVGDQTRWGLPAPDHPFGATPPIVNSALLTQVGHGEIIPVPDIAQFREHEVALTDGQVIDPDVVVFATGSTPSFDILPSDVLDPRDQDPSARPRPRTRWRLLAQTHPTLALVGLMRPMSQRLACAHWQSVVTARWLRLLAEDPERSRRLWGLPDPCAPVPSDRLLAERCWLDVDPLAYLRTLERLLVELDGAR